MEHPVYSQVSAFQSPGYRANYEENHYLTVWTCDRGHKMLQNLIFHDAPSAP